MSDDSRIKDVVTEAVASPENGEAKTPITQEQIFEAAKKIYDLRERNCVEDFPKFLALHGCRILIDVRLVGDKIEKRIIFEAIR